MSGDLARSKVSDKGLAGLRKNLRAYISLRPRDAKYFPDGVIHTGLDNFLAKWYSEDLFAMRLRPNPIRRTGGFERTAANVKSRWPELSVEPL